MKSVFAVAAALALVGLCCVVQGVTIDTVAVGDAGNAADTTGYGSVGYNCSIGKYEVTAGQYTAFLNAVAKTDTFGLYNDNMWPGCPYACSIQRSSSSGSYTYSVASDWSNRPVNYVSYWDACRFTNWLHNGQPTGEQDGSTTERGAYTLDGYNGGLAMTRNANWKWAVSSLDEWYKAAYYRGGNLNAGYWQYPTQSNTAPGRDLADASGNNANYYTSSYLISFPYYRTEVGEFQNSDSAYGTFDQGGNVSEWNEVSGVARLSGGSFLDPDAVLQSRWWTKTSAKNEFWEVGFRVVQAVPEPEPSSVVVLLSGLAGLIAMRRRRPSS